MVLDARSVVPLSRDQLQQARSVLWKTLPEEQLVALADETRPEAVKECVARGWRTTRECTPSPFDPPSTGCCASTSA